MFSVEACIAAGKEGFAVDASLAHADANKQRSIAGQDWGAKTCDPSSRAVKEYLATLDDTAWGAPATLCRSSTRRPTQRLGGPPI